MEYIILFLVVFTLFFTSFVSLDDTNQAAKERYANGKNGANKSLDLIQARENNNNLKHYSPILDEEWNINKRKSNKNEIPLTILNIYESFKKNVSINHYEARTVRCHFNDGNSSHLGLFVFNLEAYRNNETITDAELHVYISYNNLEDGSYIGFEYLVIRMYQILPTNLTDHETSTYPDLHRLLNVAYISSFQQNWQVFKAKMALEHWLAGEPNLGILITVNDKRERRLYPNFLLANDAGIYRPFLLTYAVRSSEAIVLDQNHIAKSNKNKDLNLFCKKNEWNINFKEIGWDNFMIEPKSLAANRCFGNCTYIMRKNTTFYTYLYKHYFKDEQTGQKPKLCCVPASFMSVPLMFYDKFDNVVIRVYDDLIANSCECR